MDSGFTVKHDNEIVKIGGPVTTEGITLIGEDGKGVVQGKIIHKTDEKNKSLHIGGRAVDREHP